MSAPRRSWYSTPLALAAVYLFIAGATGIKVAEHELASSHLIEQIASRQDLNSVTTMDAELKSAGMGYFTRVVLRLINPQKSSAAAAHRTQREILDDIRQLKEEFAASASASLVLLGFSLFFLLAASRGSGSPDDRIRQRLYALLCISLVFFLLGILLPVVTAVVKGKHDLIGGFIIQTSSKGIVSTVVTLAKSGNWIIAGLLTAFSIAIPLFKGGATIAATLTPSNEKRRRVAGLLETVARWALTDVLVAAVLLGCFSLNAIQQSNGGIVAVPRFAFGFFVLYCVLAARTTYLLKTVRRPAARTPARSLRLAGLVLAGSLGGGALLAAAASAQFNLVRKAGDVAVVKLVRTHTEILDRKFDAPTGKPQLVPFEIPFTGVLTVKVKGSSSFVLLVSLRHEGKPLPDWDGVASKDYRHRARLEGGKYEITLRNGSGDSGPFAGDRCRVQITLDP